jgi:hypothetical protein
MTESPNTTPEAGGPRWQNAGQHPKPPPQAARAHWRDQVDEQLAKRFPKQHGDKS